MSRRAVRPLAGAALALALAACAAPGWQKPNVTPDQAAQDYSDCSALAAAPDQRDTAIEADILASRGSDWQKSGTLDAHQDVFQADAQHRTNDLIDDCMTAKGYSPKK